METNAWSVQVPCLVVVEDGVCASRCRSEIVGVVICKGSKGEGIGIKYRGCESPLIGLAEARVVVFVRVLIAKLSGVIGSKQIVSRLVPTAADRTGSMVRRTKTALAERGRWNTANETKRRTSDPLFGPLMRL